MKPKTTYTAAEARELLKKGKANKYHAKPCRYNDISMASRLEKRFATRLNMRKMAGEIKGWEYGIEYDLCVKEISICKYVLDFRVEQNDGKFAYYDTKGVTKGTPLSLFRIKRKLMLALYNIDVKEARYNYVTKEWEIR